MKYRDELKALIDEHNVISFDIFDTLVHRLVKNSRAVAQLVELQIRRLPLSETYPFLGTSFAQTRHTAEVTARAERDKFEGDTEVTFDEIYDVLQELFGITSEVREQLKQLELDMESSILYADPNMYDVFNYAKEQNKTIVICSDMYLQKEQMKLLLERCGYNLDQVAVYVSCDYRASKWDNTLFNRIGEYKGSKALHIGDNEHSDVLMARQSGLDGFYYDYREHLPTTFIFRDSLTQSIIDGIVTKSWLEAGELSTQASIGIQIYGPLLSGMLLWLLSRLEGKHYDRVLFFARDASLFYEAITAHAKELEASLPSSFLDYVYISRTSSTLPALADFNLRNLNRMTWGTKDHRSLKDWLGPYGITDFSRIQREIKDSGFSSDEDVATGEDPRLFRLIQQLYSHIVKASIPAKQEAAQYFSQFSGENLAIVDLGWFGSLQRNFTSIRENAHTDGYYFYLWKSGLDGASRTSLHDSYSAYVNDHRSELFADIPDLLRTGGAVELLENILSGPHGTTLGYSNGEPILEEGTTGLDIHNIRDGALRFFSNLVPFLSLVSSQSLDSLDWVRPFFRMVEFPTLEEAEELGDICHSGSAGSTQHTSIPLAPKLDKEFCENPQLYKAAETTAYWKQGFKLRNKRPPLVKKKFWQK